MTDVLLLTVMLLTPKAPLDAFEVQADLQGLYDEISQATLAFETPADVDMLHDVLYSPDWVLIDQSGQRQTWTQVRERVIQALSAPRPDSMIQPIRKLTLSPDGATVVVNVTIIHAVVDTEGRYGRPGNSHTLTETTVYRDRWVRVSDAWKLTSREQMAAPKVSVDKTDRGM
jgi:hypothetical protein